MRVIDPKYAIEYSNFISLLAAWFLCVLVSSPASASVENYEYLDWEYDERVVFEGDNRVLAQLGYSTKIGNFGQKDQLLIEEIVPVFEPRTDEKTLQEVLFNESLIREFNDRYQQNFGRAAYEQHHYYNPNKYQVIEYAPGQRATLREDIEKQQIYGQYVLKRLAEFHVDDYAKNSENLKPVYKLKEQISSAQVSIRPGYKLKVRYSLSDNSLAVTLDNPTDLKTSYTVQMGDSDLAEKQGGEHIVKMQYPISKKVALTSFYKVKAKALTLVTEKVYSHRFRAHITGSTEPLEDGESKIDNKVILGFTWSR